jgi:hypothetical protein
VRKRGEQPGLDTPLVHAVNYDNSLLVMILLYFYIIISDLANALNYPPEEYGRKTKTQRNRRGLTQVVEHVV